MTTDDIEISPLFSAITEGNNEDDIRALIDAGADVNQTDKSGETALFYAVKQSNNESVVRALIDAGADVNKINNECETALFNAVRENNNESVVRALIDAGPGAGVNKTNDDGKTALFYAVRQSNNESVVRALIDAGADVNITDHNGKTVLFDAVRQGNDESVDDCALIDAGADVNKTNNNCETALFYDVLQSTNESVVRALIDAGADVNTTNNNGETALFYAVRESNNESVVRALIDAGADVNKANNRGETALFYAVRQSTNESVVRALIDAGAYYNQINNECETALFYAVRQSKNGSIVDALIDAGVDVNATNDYGETALFYAVNSKKINNQSVVRTLINAGAYINAIDTFGRTPLFYALHDPVVARILLDKGGNKNLHLKDKYNCSILRCSVERGILRDNDFESLSNAFSSDSFVLLIQLGVRKADLFETIMNIVLSDFLLMLCNDRGKRLKKYSITFKYIRELLELAREYMDEEDSHQKIENLMAILENKIENPEKMSEALRLLVELGADPNSGDGHGNTALHYATRLPLMGVGQEMVMEICQQLEKLDVQFNLRNFQNQTPFLFCLSGDVTELRQAVQLSAIKTLVNVSGFLLKHGSSIEERSRSGETVFHLILKLLHQGLELKDRKVRENILQEMIKLLQLFKPEKIARAKIIIIPDADLNTPLHLWASLALPSPQDYAISLIEDQTFEEFLQTIFKYLLKCGAKLNARNTEDQTPLHLCKTWSAAKLLLDAGANQNDVDSSGRSPLLLAAKRIQSINNSASFYPDIAVETEDATTFWKTAIEKGLDPWTADKEGESVLSIFVERESFVLAMALVDVACEKNDTHSEEVKVSLLNAICKDKSTRLNWKTNLVERILKSRKRFTPQLLSQPLSSCCKVVLETDVFGNKVEEKPESESIDVTTNEDCGTSDEQPPSKWRKLDISNDHSKEAELKKSSVHCEIIKMLRLYGADSTSCLDMADTCPGLRDLLTTPIDVDKISALIPWTSVSKKYENNLAKVARRQESDVVHDIFWYHEDHIASGAFGSVFVGINEKDGREVAIKRIEKIRMQRPEDKREITNLTALADCEQVVRYLYFFEEESFAYVVLELMEGNLDEYLTDDSTFDAGKSTQLCEDVVKGLKYLHEHDIIHRDLKPGNILYKTHPKLCLKIADFGLSRRIDSTATTVYGTNAGTRCWIAPEVLMGTHDHSKSSDIFSCGLVLHYILSIKKHPFSKNNSQVAHEIEGNITNDNTKGWDYNLCPEANHLVKDMLLHEGKNRPTAGKALNHPLFWSNRKKIDFLIAVSNQDLSKISTDLQKGFSTIVKHGSWNDERYKEFEKLYKKMIAKGFRKYNTSSVVDLIRFIRNTYGHASENNLPESIKEMLFVNYEFLDNNFPDLVMEVYKVVIAHGWDQTKDEIKWKIE